MRERAAVALERRAIARVDEARCVGCTRCIDACPVDAIVGAQELMHTVVEDWCIGCDLCIPACPVDCIERVAAQRPWTPELKAAAGARAGARKERLSGQFAQPFDPKGIVAALLGREP